MLLDLGPGCPRARENWGDGRSQREEQKELAAL